jgi:hypothetical protein
MNPIKSPFFQVKMAKGTIVQDSISGLLKSMPVKGMNLWPGA